MINVGISVSDDGGWCRYCGGDRSGVVVGVVVGIDVDVGGGVSVGVRVLMWVVVQV